MGHTPPGKCAVSAATVYKPALKGEFPNKDYGMKGAGAISQRLML